MAPWLEEYMIVLDARDAVEKAHQDIYDAYARLADRTATQSLSNTATEAEPAPTPVVIRPSSIRTPTSPSPTSTGALAADLATAQSARSALQSQLSTLQTTHAATVKQLDTLRSSYTSLSTHHTSLQIRFKDRDSELRGKAKLLENLQDELATTEIELNMQSKDMERLKQENQALVDRWMKKIQGEAEEMNVALEGAARRRRRSSGTGEVEHKS